jgi:hypothetical protein
MKGEFFTAGLKTRPFKAIFFATDFRTKFPAASFLQLIP